MILLESGEYPQWFIVMLFCLFLMNCMLTPEQFCSPSLICRNPEFKSLTLDAESFSTRLLAKKIQPCKEKCDRKKDPCKDNCRKKKGRTAMAKTKTKEEVRKKVKACKARCTNKSFRCKYKCYCKKNGSTNCKEKCTAGVKRCIARKESRKELQELAILKTFCHKDRKDNVKNCFRDCCHKHRPAPKPPKTPAPKTPAPQTPAPTDPGAESSSSSSSAAEESSAAGDSSSSATELPSTLAPTSVRKIQIVDALLLDFSPFQQPIFL